MTTKITTTPPVPKVLVVDDFQLNRSILARQLEALGYASDQAENGEQAMLMWFSGNYALIITDCEMPVSDGFELARSIRAIEARIARRKRTPILASTAYSRGDTQEKCRAAGIDEVLPKPIALKELGRKVSEWVELA